jgi:UPF0755 protein
MKSIFSNLWLIIGIPVGLLIIGIASAVWWYNYALSPLTPPSSDGTFAICCRIEFAINDGDTTDTIAKNLENQNVIRSALAFTIYAKLNNVNSIKSGTYELWSSYDVPTIAEILTRGTPSREVFTIRFIPGDTIMPMGVGEKDSRGIRQRIIDAGYPAETVDVALAYEYEHPVLRDLPADLTGVTRLEGYIWGDDYQFFVGTTVETIISTALDALWTTVQDNNLVSEYATHGLNLHQGITLASITTREARQYETMQRVSQVFLNRLNAGMTLGSDATVAYAATQINPSRDKSDMSYISSILCTDMPWGPYNTRKCKGLPPAPIAVPSLNALLSVGTPDANYAGYYYFLTGDDGIMYYARTYEEHTANKVHCPQTCALL